MLKSIFCDYGDAYILASGAITITEKGAEQATGQADKKR